MLVALGFSSIAHAEELVNNLHFPGHYYDEESGLYYNWNRYYNPKTGRYISSDPIGIDGGENLYSYASQDPLSNFDYNGLFSVDVRDAEGQNSVQDLGEWIGNSICREFNKLWRIRYREELTRIRLYRESLGECEVGCWIICAEKTRHQHRECISDVFSSAGFCPRQDLATPVNNFVSYKCFNGIFYGESQGECCPSSVLPPEFN